MSLNRAVATVEILTGDNDVITRTICQQVGLPVERIVLGREVEGMNDAALEEAAEKASIFKSVDFREGLAALKKPA